MGSINRNGEQCNRHKHRAHKIQKYMPFSTITATSSNAVILMKNTYVQKMKQKALLWQRDRTTRLSVEILQLQNILFEN